MNAECDYPDAIERDVHALWDAANHIYRIPPFKLWMHLDSLREVAERIRGQISVIERMIATEGAEHADT